MSVYKRVISSAISIVQNTIGDPLNVVNLRKYTLHSIILVDLSIM